MQYKTLPNIWDDRGDERRQEGLENNVQREKYRGVLALSTHSSCRGNMLCLACNLLPVRRTLKTENATYYLKRKTKE